MKAKLEIIGSMAAFGTIGAFVRHIPLPSGELALYRALIAAGAIFLWQLCSGQGTGIKDAKAELHLLILSGAAIGINWILIFRTYIFPYVSCPLFCIYKTGGFPGFFRGIRLFFILTCIRQDPRTQSM